MNLHKYTLQQLQIAVTSSVSIRQCLQKLNVVPAGGNYETFKKAVKYYNIDISHFSGQNLSGHCLPRRRKALHEYLRKGSSIQSFKLKNYLLEDKVFVHECSICGITTWQGKKTPIELDHINGDSSNNELSNLRLLCPNCHAQTPTYRGKNKIKL